MNFKDIHIGQFVEKLVSETNLERSRISSSLHCSDEDIEKLYQSKSLDTDVVLCLSKLLEYDLFRIYSQHLILYSPPKRVGNHQKQEKKTQLPQFRKNIYTKEVIDFILTLISTGKMTKHQVISEYRIPKTTLYKWISKYKV